MKGAKDVLKMCYNPIHGPKGKQRARHTVQEAKDCMKAMEQGLHESVEPDKKRRQSLI
jgi:hypothetical protein